ncbi:MULTISPECIES: peptidase [Bifidobacterium]|uniref:Peptidase n=1 Tax=Bifidobacterium saimiriisciurei TaxID=2661627 RepID=A0ABX0C9K0_9BIFI|nr:MULTISPECIES: peptidase [Bifidobacterium]NEH11371.1 peptidase [Bifidobacterium saimiriisciurei]
MWRRICRSLIAVVVVMMGLGSAGSASAATMHAPVDSQLWYTFNGERYNIGVIAVAPNGRNAYCIETGVPASYEYGEAMAIKDSAAARQVAYLADAYQSNTDPTTQAAIAMLIHDHFEALDKPLWQQRKAAFLKEHPTVQARADALWKEAAGRVVTTTSATVTYLEGKRSGYVDVEITGSGGAKVTGVPYTVKLTGPATFDNGKNTATGKTAAKTIRLAWKATDAGSVTANVSYDHGTIERLTSGQDYLRYGTSASEKKDVVTFDVVKTFQPGLTTVVGDKIVDAGDEVTDKVTSTLADGDTWKSGAAIKADGYYFAGIKPKALGQGIAPKAGEKAKDFLARLKAAGYSPAAYGTAEFTGAGQSKEVRAVTAPDGNEPYRSNGNGHAGFGTWVWTVDRERQTESVREWIRADFSSALMERPETLSVRTPAAVDSTATEHTGVIGSELSDQIAVTGFPDDHGEFKGSEEYGFGADVERAQVSVWWAGDAENPKNNKRYKPNGAAVPKEDDHHKRIGTWEYPAKNGRIKVGGGVPDADGKPVTITAERAGYYVFVYSFAGDDRVQAVTSAYDDAWERVYIEPDGERHMPDITTAVIPPVTTVGKEFLDSAKVTGHLESGSYVTFTAYEPVGDDVEPGTGSRILDEARVELDAGKTAQTVVSPGVKADKPGRVYWKATLWSPDGEVIDSHPLGIDGEITTVEEEPEEPAPEEPQEPQPEQPGSLPVTGVGQTIPLMGAGAAALATVGLMLAAIRRRS